ncbi:hypothetical protein ADL07_29175 [Streptomyces sp. NRRL F-4707]|nr:hypothetical protein ADK87_27215 [Streptomyces sp. NRRL F-4711]KOX27770.1 hypothetical protein ADL07_29175 [Streptomyces sp. NRRL F-4707]KOX45716.1 hypothetical protein ADL09_21190 [Streptomyces sp. NRRL F-7442]
MQGRIGVAQPDPAPGPAGGEFQPGQQVDDCEPGRAQSADVADDHPGPGGFQQRAHLVAEPARLPSGDGPRQHEHGGCHGVHVR